MAEYRSIDADARAICHEEDESAQVYNGHTGEVMRAVDAAIGKANAIDERLARLREAHPTPEWAVVAFARAGSVYDCIWAGLRAAKPQLVTPKQQVLLLKLQARVQGPFTANQVQQQIADTRAAVQATAATTRCAHAETRLSPSTHPGTVTHARSCCHRRTGV